MNDVRQPTPEESLQRLREGNERFVAGAHNRTLQGWHKGIVDGQQPFAVVLGCSDSRAPGELVFDQGLGDLFMIRLAGNIVSPSGVGSVEFAVSQFGTKLVVVMGHTRCGAVNAAVQSLEGELPPTKNLKSITDRITPHIQGIVRLAQKQGTDRATMMREAVRANTLASADQMRHGSRMIEDLVVSGQIVVVAAEYELESGKVEFL